MSAVNLGSTPLRQRQRPGQGAPALDWSSSIASRAAVRPRGELLARQARALSTHADLAGIGGRTDEPRALAAGADLAGIGGRTGEARALAAGADLAGIGGRTGEARALAA